MDEGATGSEKVRDNALRMKLNSVCRSTAACDANLFAEVEDHWESDGSGVADGLLGAELSTGHRLQTPPPITNNVPRYEIVAELTSSLIKALCESLVLLQNI